VYVIAAGNRANGGVCLYVCLTVHVMLHVTTCHHQLLCCAAADHLLSHAFCNMLLLRLLQVHELLRISRASEA
jgi:hypothetical protein